MKKTFYCVRHGRTEWNKERRFQGISDIPLSEEGILQARKAKPMYDKLYFEEIFSSPLSRAVETAKIITEDRHLPIRIDERIIERSFGRFEGEFINDCDIGTLHIEEPDYGGEDPDHCAFRFRGFLDDLVLHDEKEYYLIVSHGGCIGNFIRSLYEEEGKKQVLPRGKLPNCSLTVIEWEDGRYDVKKIGYTED